MVVLMEKRMYEMHYNAKNQLEAYMLIHKILWVNSDDAIDANNKIYLPYSQASDMIKQKVRVINSQGKVINMSNSSIKESKDDESEKTYKYFATEGVDKGSKIEYYFVLKYYPDFSGSRITLQSSNMKENVDVTIITPSNLVMKCKSYNGLPEMELDSSETEMNVLHLHVDTMAALEDEPFSNSDANLQYVLYKLSKNTYAGSNEVVTFSKYAQSIYEVTYIDISSSVKKKLQKVLKDADIESYKDTESKVRNLEEYIKTAFRISDQKVNAAEDLSSVCDNKVADEYGLLRLYIALFNLLDIDAQVVITNNRYDMYFDPEFESFIFLEDMLLYFPDLDKYMVLGDVFSRLGYINTGYLNNYGLFLKQVEIGGVKTAISQVKKIEPLPYDKVEDNMRVEVDLNKNISSPEYTFHREQTGYYAQSTQVIYDYVDADTKKKIDEGQVKDVTENMTVEHVDLTNTGSKFFGVKPLITNARFTSTEFVEKAGDNYLFNVGLLIGPQAEIYNEKPRVMEIENGFNRGYHRVIIFTIPDGYVCDNLNDLNIDVYQEREGERTMAFTSSYTVNGNTVEVTVDEYYKLLTLPVSEFEEYRSVINASANFNKISLVLQPK